MRRVLNAYVRRFNRSRQRDGALFRGRFRSRPVTTESYRRVLVRYIDFNPVEAELVTDPVDFPHGSAARHVRGSGARWLERSWIRSRVQSAASQTEVTRSAYAAAFGARPDKALNELVRWRLQTPTSALDPLDELLSAAPDAVRAWMTRKAALADGTQAGMAVCDPTSIRRAVAAVRAECPHAVSATSRGPTCHADPWLRIENALLRQLANLSGRECGALLGRTASWSWRAQQEHRTALSDPAYADVVAKIVIRSQAPLVNPSD